MTRHNIDNSNVSAVEPLLQVKDLRVAFRQEQQLLEVVKGVSFDIYPGETLALVGESGSGKSLTAHSILKLLPYPLASHPGGQILFNGTDLLGYDQKRMQRLRGNRISMIFQEPMSALNPLHTVEKQVGEIIMQHRGINRRQARPRVLELLHKVRIPDPESRLQAFPHELSGGQRQRVMIAMALANEPDLLIADEPTTALDVTVQQEILALLQSLQREQQLTLLLITHDLVMVRRIAGRVAVMCEGRIVEQSDCEQLFLAPQHPYTRKLLASESTGGPAPARQPDAAPVLSCRDLSVRFPLQKSLLGKTRRWLQAVDSISLDIRPGTTLGIVGESGSGKSTLALAILRLLQSEGEIRLHQHPLHGLRERKLRPFRRHLQVVFQDPFSSLSPRMTAGEIIAEGLRVHTRYTPGEQSLQVIDVMREVGLDPATRNRYPHEFSGGQRQRIAIARALILNPEVIVLDEPTSALDKTVQVQVVELLRKLQQQRGLTYLFISHDLAVVRALSHRIIVMKDGRVVEEGEAEQVLNRPQEAYTQALLTASLGLAQGHTKTGQR